MDDGVDCLPLIGSGEHLLECVVKPSFESYQLPGLSKQGIVEWRRRRRRRGSSMTVSSVAGHQQAYLVYSTIP